jgi:hypothetical protein
MLPACVPRVLAVAVVVAVAVLRTPSVPPAGPSDSQAAVPVVDARSRQLTAAADRTTMMTTSTYQDGTP